ncbi:unnamed protein product [Orchesella dallaii]|uniref:Uncharacterized protein n=1 Tax=Orchesella dallaii TaxID=48710 RepID=A0ABP1QYT5_9HEXA
MDSETQYVDTEKLQQENQKLRKEMRDLVIQKNTMEDRLYRAINKLLNTKKRRIKKLEGELEKLKKGEGSSDADNHCKTCRCAEAADEDEQSDNEPAVKKTRRSKGAPILISDDDDEADSDNTHDPGSGYGSETDIDEEPASKSASTSSSPNKQKTVIVAVASNESEPKPENSASLDAAEALLSKTDDHDKEDSQSILSPEVQVPKPSLPNPESQGSQKSDYDMEELMDEFCS